ncbi:hypothetical protein [Thiohalocapsa sp. ML1]|uniref:hypothetical protein n=1 Tax=Thiohalocapsa sp. ML1 TaxID=1431688 RepID=UPI0007323ECF|nr:hypothetical protein [Thiohalocapsa sp. ML1]
MALTQEDIAFIKTHMAEWLTEQSLGKPAAVYEIELRERMVRVEEELKHQRELMREGFAQVERRLEQIDKRFDQVDKRFEQIDKRLEQIDRRFEQVDSRFDEMIRRHDRHFLWLIGFITSVGALIIAAGKFW